ncbi:MAG: hypothetical protein STSR0002_13730 [Smithella sp.]
MIDKYIADYDAYGNSLTSKTAAHPAITYAYDSIAGINPGTAYWF